MRLVYIFGTTDAASVVGSVDADAGAGDDDQVTMIQVTMVACIYW
jgi:hypothetical protein